jgi:natural resistance-associated macrophage protein 2
MAVSGDIITLAEDLGHRHHHHTRHHNNDNHHSNNVNGHAASNNNINNDNNMEVVNHDTTNGTETTESDTLRSFLEVSDGADPNHDNVDYNNNNNDDYEEDGITGSLPVWEPSGCWWKDLLHFCGPGWLVSIAYVDPGNYQADIQAGATTRYELLWTIWWTSILSIYVQVLCVRLGYGTQCTLAQVQARELKQYEQQYEQQHGGNSVDGSIVTSLRKSWRRYFAWFVAEFSVVLTDLPEVIGFGIACNLFFGWPYWIGVIGSLLTTMVFLATMNFGMRVLEGIIFVFVGIMSIALFVEMGFVGVDVPALTKGWVYGFVDATSDDLFAIVGILGAVVMPHNLYLHTGTVQTRKVKQTPEIIDTAILYCSWEPVLPIIVSFFVNMAVVSIAAESVFGAPGAANVGLTDFCQYFQGLKGGCVLWGVALMSAGQSR